MTYLKPFAWDQKAFVASSFYLMFLIVIKELMALSWPFLIWSRKKDIIKSDDFWHCFKSCNDVSTMLLGSDENVEYTRKCIWNYRTLVCHFFSLIISFHRAILHKPYAKSNLELKHYVSYLILVFRNISCPFLNPLLILLYVKIVFGFFVSRLIRVIEAHPSPNSNQIAAILSTILLKGLSTAKTLKVLLL